MRFRFKPTPDQRAALQAQLARLQEPATLLDILTAALPAGFHATGLTCTVPSAHSDRFVMRAQVRSAAGDERGFALKVYSDDFGERVWTHARALAQHHRPNGAGLCLPSRYIADERMLVFPWVDGQFLSEIVDARKPGLLREAAHLAATLHRLPVVPEHPTTPQMLLEEARARCDRLHGRWPDVALVVEPLMALLEAAAAALDPIDPAPVHGDLAAGQFLWTGQRLVLLDLDMFGYTDPAYDAGHFLGQLDRRCMWDLTLPAHAAQWLTCFREAYLAAMPTVSPRNVAFYHGLTLVRKMYTVCRRQPDEGPKLVPRLAVRARAALDAVTAAERSP